MVTLITDILTPNYQMSNKAFGEVVTDADDILQSIHNIFFTLRGTVPLDHEFGSVMMSYQDMPINKVIPNVIAEGYRAIKAHEPRVTVRSIKPDVDQWNNIAFVFDLLVTGSAAPLQYILKRISTGSGNVQVFADVFSDVFN